MASIHVTNIRGVCCDITLINLDTSWDGGDRTAFYTISHNNIIEQKYTTTITGAPSEGGHIFVTMLSPNTTYKVSCTVYDAYEYVLATISSVTFTTTDTSSEDNITIWNGKFYVTQTAYNEKQAIVEFNCDDGVIGGTYYISINNVSKTSGTITKEILNNGVTITFDEFGPYVVGLSIKSPSGNTTLTKEKENITIEGEGLEQKRWYYITSSTIGELNSRYRKKFGAGALVSQKYSHVVYRYSMTFSKSGKALFYNKGGKNDLYIDLSEDTEYIYGGMWSVLQPSNSMAASKGFNPKFACEVEAGVTYYLWIRCGYTDNSSSETIVIVPPIDTWDWESDENKRDAYRALTENGPTTDFNYTVWNELVNKVDMVAGSDPNAGAWRLSVDDGAVYTPGQTKINPNISKVLEADKFNTLRYNVCKYVYTGIGIKKPLDPVIGQEIIKITDCLNIWITEIFK